jgi:hypothetical protein
MSERETVVELSFRCGLLSVRREAKNRVTIQCGPSGVKASAPLALCGCGPSASSGGRIGSSGNQETKRGEGPREKSSTSSSASSPRCVAVSAHCEGGLATLRVRQWSSREAAAAGTLQANCRTHRPQKLKCLIFLCTNPVPILSVPIHAVR